MAISQNKLYIIIATAFALLSPVTAFSQSATLSPYSRYGLGDLMFHGFSHQRAMGGLSAGLQQASHLNFGNAASYAVDSIVMFELGVTGEAVNLSNESASQDKVNGNISYISMGFPLIKNYWYLSLGMLPFSASGYNIKQATTTPAPGNATFIYQGSGGYNRFFAGTGFKLNRKFSLGVNASYLYGSAVRLTKVEFTEAGFVNTLFQNSITLSDLFVEGGLQYSTFTKKGLKITLGLTAAPSQNINAKRKLIWFNYLNSVAKDTAFAEDEKKGQVKLPLQAGFGFSVSKNENWLIGADIKMQQWEEFESFGINDSLRNSFRLGIGGQWSPDPSGRYFSRSIYRAGAYFNKGFLELNNDPINDIGFSLGAGFGLTGRPYFSHLDVSFELGQRGTTENNLVRERYARVILGLTFRESWFNKPKFD